MKSIVRKSGYGSIKISFSSCFSRLQIVSNFNTGCIEELLVGCITQLLRRGTQILEQFYESWMVN